MAAAARERVRLLSKSVAPSRKREGDGAPRGANPNGSRSEDRAGTSRRANRSGYGTGPRFSVTVSGA
jgi:hypothetical protein